MDLYNSTNYKYDEESNVYGQVCPENAFSFALDHRIRDFFLAEDHWYCDGKPKVLGCK